VVERALGRLTLQADELVVDVGAGTGALTLPLARAGVRVLAIERDRHLLRQLQATLETEGLASRVQLRRGDLREVPWPTGRYRVVANPPFALTTRLLARLLDDAEAGPSRADLLLQWDVARKRAALPPTSLRTAAWLPWWHFELGERVDRSAFRPVPAVDAGWLSIVRRDPPLLPTALSSCYLDEIAPAWDRAHGGGGRPGRR
jgi:23S rRNA (adenine-N6)-dimethyltransferase